MPEIVERQRIRIKADSTNFGKPANERAVDRQSLKLWSGSATQIESGHFLGNDLASVANFTHVVAQIRNAAANGGAPTPDGSYLAQSIVEAGDFDTTLDATSWTDKSKQHFLFTFSDEEMAQTGTKWLHIYATTAGGNTVTLVACTIEFVQDGGPSLEAPDPVTENAWPKSEADARYALKIESIGELQANKADVDGPGKWWAGANGEFVIWVAAANGGAGAQLTLNGSYDY